jgi:hypothetical protein
MLVESIIYDGQAVLVDFIPAEFTTKFDEMWKIVQEDPTLKSHMPSVFSA